MKRTTEYFTDFALAIRYVTKQCNNIIDETTVKLHFNRIKFHEFLRFWKISRGFIFTIWRTFSEKPKMQVAITQKMDLFSWTDDFACFREKGKIR